MKTYIINLKRSIDRKIYMQEILRQLPCLTPEFIEAVDGSTMDYEEIQQCFNTKKFSLRYSYTPRPGEIGATLSHQKCYRKIVKEQDSYALILEDDIVLPTGINEIIENIERYLSKDTPHIVLLSGWYWYRTTSPLKKRYKLANVYDGYLAHAYIVNLFAAKALIEKRPFIVADDWLYIRRKGIKIQAINPHLIDQKWDGSIDTTVNTNKRKPLKRIVLRNIFRILFIKFMHRILYFEKATL